MIGSGESALSGRRVLEIADASGAYCGKLLADMGADVIKIEAPGGARERSIPPFLDGMPGKDRSLHFLYMNTSKRGITLDIERPEGRSLQILRVYAAGMGPGHRGRASGQEAVYDPPYAGGQRPRLRLAPGEQIARQQGLELPFGPADEHALITHEVGAREDHVGQVEAPTVGRSQDRGPVNTPIGGAPRERHRLAGLVVDAPHRDAVEHQTRLMMLLEEAPGRGTQG